MSRSSRSSVTEIPREIRGQEAEIESLFWNLIRHGNGSGLHRRRRAPNHRGIQEALGGTLIAMLGLISVIAFFILWLKV